MNKKAFIAFGVIVAGAIGWWLLSPLWRNVRLDEGPPQQASVPAVKDNIDRMDAATQERFTKETVVIKDKAMKVTEAAPSSQPIVLAQADMVARAHDVSGKAVLVQIGDQKIVRFENLKTSNGPDLRIYLSAGLSADDYVDLGPIRATEGNVNYTVPAGTDTSKYRNVLIWCRAFSVLFSYAQL